MKRGFTLLELIIVIIIIGILATLGFTQYGRMMERSRGAEAKMICGTIRTMAAGYRLETGNLSGWSSTSAGIGNASDQIPGPGLGNCTGTNYFVYSVSGVTDNQLTITATRCNASGKAPGGTTTNTLTLISNLSNGSDSWGGTGGY